MTIRTIYNAMQTSVPWKFRYLCDKV